MKTVMKKMFSLLLVAVLLVSAVPFAASAHTVGEGKVIVPVTVYIDGVNQDGYNKTIELTETKSSYTLDAAGGLDLLSSSEGRVFEKWVTSTRKTLTDENPGSINYTTLKDTTEPYSLELYIKTVTIDPCANGHTPGAAATCTTAQTCTVCGETLVTAKDHTYHDDLICTVCNYCKHCQRNDGTHPETCPNSDEYHKKCSICGTDYTAVEGHPVCTICGNELSSATNPCHSTANCPYCKVCLEKGNYVKDHEASDHCGECGSLDHKTSAHCTKCGKTDGTHKTDCPDYVSSGSSKVKIYANLYTGDVLTKTVPLVVYNEDPNTSIADSIAEHKDLIYAELEDQYSGYEWSGNVYDSENEDGENMNSKVGKGINVHINAHSKENIVYLYVHNARTYDRIGIVRLHGKKVGEAVKESEVRKAVKEYFSFSSLKMYDTEKWDLYVDGKDVKSDDTLTVGSNHYVIDVKISGSAKNTSGAKADSSNPKTGDAIFAPAAVLGLSATTLAVLFYLNKKRAY